MINMTNRMSLETNIEDFEIFRKMYYTNSVKVNGETYLLNQCPYLDLILTDRCNARCKFCVAHLVHEKEDCNFLTHTEQILYAVNNLNVKEVLLLGGEPTVSKDLFPIIHFLNNLNLDKICITTNGIKLRNEKFRWELLRSGITHMNISVMSLNPKKQKEINGVSKNIDLETLKEVYKLANVFGVNVRINTNVFKENNDTIQDMLKFYDSVKAYCHSIKFSPLLKTDSFSTINEVTEFNRQKILSDNEYEELWTKLERVLGDFPIVRNKKCLGFVEYSMIMCNPPIFLNYNHRGKMMKNVTEEKKINSIKLLTNGHLSLSWNREMPEYYIR